MSQTNSCVNYNDIQGHTDLNHENNEWLISYWFRLFHKLFKQMPIKFAVKLVQLKVNILIFASPMT